MRAAAGHVELGDRHAVLAKARHRSVATHLPVEEGDVLDIGVDQRGVVAGVIERRHEVRGDDVVIGEVGGNRLEIINETLGHFGADLIPFLSAAILQVERHEGVEVNVAFAFGNAAGIGAHLLHPAGEVSDQLAILQIEEALAEFFDIGMRFFDPEEFLHALAKLELQRLVERQMHGHRLEIGVFKCIDPVLEPRRQIETGHHMREDLRDVQPGHDRLARANGLAADQFQAFGFAAFDQDLPYLGIEPHSAAEMFETPQQRAGQCARSANRNTAAKAEHVRQDHVEAKTGAVVERVDHRFGGIARQGNADLGMFHPFADQVPRADRLRADHLLPFGRAVEHHRLHAGAGRHRIHAHHQHIHGQIDLGAEPPEIVRILWRELGHRGASAVEIAPEFQHAAIVKCQRGHLVGCGIGQAKVAQQPQFIVADQRVAHQHRMRHRTDIVMETFACDGRGGNAAADFVAPLDNAYLLPGLGQITPDNQRVMARAGNDHIIRIAHHVPLGILGKLSAKRRCCKKKRQHV